MPDKKWGLSDSFRDYGRAVREAEMLRMQGYGAKITEKKDDRNGRYRVWVNFRLDERYGKKKGAWAKKLDKPLYHGTSEEDAYRVYYGRGFKDYVYVVDDPKMAEQYAKARTVNVLKHAPEGAYFLARGFKEEPKYAVYEFKSIPDKAELVEDDYNKEGEKGQYIIRAPIIRPIHYRMKGGQEYVAKPLTKDKTERLMLECFGIGMLQGDRPKRKKRR